MAEVALERRELQQVEAVTVLASRSTGGSGIPDATPIRQFEYVAIFLDYTGLGGQVVLTATFALDTQAD
jgi:hypothetical protein